MRTADEEDALAELRYFARICAANVLIVGPINASQRDDILQVIRSERNCEVFHAQQGVRLVLPEAAATITVLDDVSRLSEHEQQWLLHWLDRPGHQIVSFASAPVYPLVQAGLFMAPLFYRLNVISHAIEPVEMH
jgi:hypothetical protein